jgi:hypothetical protein
MLQRIGETRRRKRSTTAWEKRGRKRDSGASRTYGKIGN